VERASPPERSGKKAGQRLWTLNGRASGPGPHRPNVNLDRAAADGRLRWKREASRRH
jgi:hypothetical protein